MMKVSIKYYFVELHFVAVACASAFRISYSPSLDF
jgi:hypothetical protein